jgi:hypothetical protein
MLKIVYYLPLVEPERADAASISDSDQTIRGPTSRAR